MALIRFVSNGQIVLQSIVSSDGRMPTVLSVARQAGVGVLFNCEVGDCAACIVGVRTLRAPAQGVFPLTDKERFLLRAMGRLTDADIADADAGRRPANVRLACQYRVGDEHIIVDYGHAMGGG